MKFNKNQLCIIMASVAGVAAIVVACILFFGGEEPKEKAIELMHRTLDENYKFALEGDDGTVLLTGKDVEEVYLMFRNGENRYLEIRFTEDGKEKFEDAIDDYDKLTITLDGEVLVKDVVANEYDSQLAKIEGEYSVIMGYFNEMT